MLRAVGSHDTKLFGETDLMRALQPMLRHPADEVAVAPGRIAMPSVHLHLPSMNRHDVDGLVHVTQNPVFTSKTATTPAAARPMTIPAFVSTAVGDFRLSNRVKS